MIKRLKTPEVKVGSILIGGDNSIVIQSMTNTDTANAVATAKQCMQLADAGANVVRITVNDQPSASAVPKIRKLLDSKGYKDLPLVGDFHFNGQVLLKENPLCASTLDKYRINPGNVGFGKGKDTNFEEIIKIALKNKKPIRIGVNSGSINQRLLTSMMEQNAKRKNPSPDEDIRISAAVKSALSSALHAEKLGMKRNQIILSVKLSDVQSVIKAHRLLVQEMKKNRKIYALHIGLTEAGPGDDGVIASAIALSTLLQDGIGDTIRISLTPQKGESRTKEVEVCKTLLQSLGFAQYKPKITSCPGCGRTDNQFFQNLVQEIVKYLDKNRPKWEKKYPKIKSSKIAIMGCIVNGPGESRSADVAIHLPGKGEGKMASVYMHGKFYKTLQGKNIAEDFMRIIEQDFLK